MDEIKAKILDVLKREGPQTVYQIAKALGLTYGAAQWHVFYLEKEGLVQTYRVGRRRYVAINPSGDVLKVLRVRDVLSDVELTLMAYGIKPDMSVDEAVEILEEKEMKHIAELVQWMARERYEREAERRQKINRESPPGP
ncbi:MAG: winged helix-turn-helix domain-containing protein [Thermoproteus sp.]